MSENLRDEMRRALKQTWRDRAMSVSFDVTWRAMTDAAWEVVGPELDRLRAGHSGGRVGCNHEGGICSDFDGYKRAAKHYRAERDVLRARLAKVEALADEWQRACDRGENGRHGYHSAEYGDDYAADVRAALASVPEPSDSEPHAPCCDACGGSGASDEASSNGLCWDCRGTGCAHEPSEPAPDADREAGEW